MTGHLIHIGYPKTGTNYLRRWFSGHPQLSYAEGGIAGFHRVYDIARLAALPPANALYRVTSCEGMAAPHANAGQLTVDYTHMGRPVCEAQASVCDTLASLFPNAHVLMVTRGFRSMILSSYSQYARSGGTQSLADLIANSSAEAPWLYDAMVARYTAAFGASKLIVLPYELLRDDADAFTRALEDRLGLAHAPAGTARVNTSLTPAEMVWYPRFTRVANRLPIGGRLRASVARGVMRNRWRGLAGVLQRLRPGTPVTAASIPDAVLEAFRGEAASLADHPLYAPYAHEYLND